MTIVGCKMAMKASLLGGLCAAVLCMGMAGAAWAETTAQSSSKPVTATADTTQVVAAADAPAAATTTTTTTTEATKPAVAKTKHTKHKKHKKAAKPAVAAATAAPAAAKAAGSAAKAAPVSEYAAEGSKTCLNCHGGDTKITAIFNTPHAKKADPRTPFAAHECESCHGASPDHINGPQRTNIGIVFTKHSPTPVAEQNKMCLACHENGARMNWQGSQHQSADVACAS